MDEMRYWRCSRCEVIVPGPTDRTAPCLPCWANDKMDIPLELVAVLPVAELAALRAREIDWERYNTLDTEVEQLRALRARVDSVTVLPKPHGSNKHTFEPRGCGYCEGWEDGIDAYRATLKGVT